MLSLVRYGIAGSAAVDIGGADAPYAFCPQYTLNLEPSIVQPFVTTPS